MNRHTLYMAGPPILVIDDTPVNLKLMRLLLTHEGYEVRTAERAEDALEMLSDYRPELILADIQLPGMDGLELTRRLKENPKTSSLRVIALTAHAMKEDRERALGAGCEDYITKPIDTSALASKVRELLAHPPVPAVEKAPIDPPIQTQTLSGPEIEALRQSFLNEGAEQSRHLLDSLNTGFDRAHAAGQLHAWIGSASLLGYHDIPAMVRKGEELLRQEPLNLNHLRVVFTDLFLIFAEMRESQVAPVPDYIAEATTGKRVALIAFTMERADALCAVLERVKARPRLFDPTDAPDSPAIGDCDIVLFHVRPETMGSLWLQPDAPIPAATKLVLTGEQQDLLALPAEVRSRATDFLLGRVDPQEVLLRLAFAFSRTTVAAAPPPPPPSAPVAAPAPATPAPATRPRMAVSSPTVVLADDDSIVRALVGTTLQNYGMSCHAADNGLAALNLIRSEQPHVAVLDVNMPVMDGYEVLAAIRAEKIPSRVILLTSLGQEKDILRAFNMGADDYVTKPFNPFELVARLKRLLQ